MVGLRKWILIEKKRKMIMMVSMMLFVRTQLRINIKKEKSLLRKNVIDPIVLMGIKRWVWLEIRLNIFLI